MRGITRVAKQRSNPYIKSKGKEALCASTKELLFVFDTPHTENEVKWNGVRFYESSRCVGITRVAKQRSNPYIKKKIRTK